MPDCMYQDLFGRFRDFFFPEGGWASCGLHCLLSLLALSVQSYCAAAATPSLVLNTGFEDGGEEPGWWARHPREESHRFVGLGDAIRAYEGHVGGTHGIRIVGEQESGLRARDHAHLTPLHEFMKNGGDRTRNPTVAKPGRRDHGQFPTDQLTAAEPCGTQ